MSIILDVLPEIQDRIFNYCCGADLQTLACCNTTFNKALQQVLWQTLNIPLGSLELENFKNKKKFKNFQYTTTIRFRGDYSIKGETQNNTNQKGESQKRMKKISNNFQKLLTYCKSDVLESLSMEGATICGNDIATTCKALTKLKTLTISHVVHIEAKDFEVIAKLRDLVELRLKYTNVGDSFLSTIAEKLTNLKTLSLRRCSGVTNTGLAALDKMNTLQSLDLSGCEGIGETGLSSMSNMVNLHHLDVSHCGEVKDTALAAVTKLIGLRTLNLSWCKNIKEDNLHALTELKELKALNLSRCAFIGNAGLSAICILGSLQSVHLDACVHIGDEGVKVVSQKLKDLRMLGLVYTSVGDDGIIHLQNLPYLTELDVTGCTNITDHGFGILATFPKLKKLNASHTQVSDDGIPSFEESTIQALNLNSCMSLSNTSLLHLSKMPALRVLDIGFTDFTDEGNVTGEKMWESVDTGFKHLHRINTLHCKISEEGKTRLSGRFVVGEIIPW